MTQTNPEQWAVELWRKACHDYGGMSIEGGWGEQDAALAIQAAFSEREARLVGALESANTLLTKAVGDIVALNIMAGKRSSKSFTAEYVEAINAIDATLAALQDRTHG